MENCVKTFMKIDDPLIQLVYCGAEMGPYFVFSWQSHINKNPQEYHYEINSDTKVTLE